MGTTTPTAPSARRSPLWSWLTWGVLLATAAPLPALLWPYWASELFISITHLLALLALGLAVGLASRGRRGRALLALAIAALDLALVLRPVDAGQTWVGDAWTTAPTSAAAAGPMTCAQPLRVVSLNLLFNNRSQNIVTDYLDSGPFDVALLQEYNTWYHWSDMLDRLRDRYPYQRATDRRDVAILSRVPFVDSPVDATVATALDSLFLASGTIHATVRIRGRDVVLLAAHLSSPQTQGLYKERNRQLSLLADLLRSLDTPVILGADLNGVRWNPRITGFFRGAGLRYLDTGFPPPATRPNWLPVLGMQIDYIAPTADAFTGVQTVGPDVGSDHLPLEATLCPTWKADPR